MTLEQALWVANQLSEIDKLRLIQQLMQDMKLTSLAESQQPRSSSFGVLAHLGTAPSAAEIDAARQAMSANFGETL